MKLIQIDKDNLHKIILLKALFDMKSTILNAANLTACSSRISDCGSCRHEWSTVGACNTKAPWTEQDFADFKGNFSDCRSFVSFGRIRSKNRRMSCFLALTCKEKVRTLSICGRQWPKVYDLCHTFLYVARVKTHTDMRVSHANACDSRMCGCVL